MVGEWSFKLNKHVVALCEIKILAAMPVRKVISFLKNPKKSSCHANHVIHLQMPAGGCHRRHPPVCCDVRQKLLNHDGRLAVFHLLVRSTVD